MLILNFCPGCVTFLRTCSFVVSDMIPQRLPLHCVSGQALLLMEVLINYYYPHLKEESQLDSWWDWLGSPSLVNLNPTPYSQPKSELLPGLHSQVEM